MGYAKRQHIDRLERNVRRDGRASEGAPAKEYPSVRPRPTPPNFNWLAYCAHATSRHDRSRYHEYMRSCAWRRVRKAALKRTGGKCERCDSTSRLHVHHLTYARLGGERPEDLQVLCEPCHNALHNPLAQAPPANAEYRRRMREAFEGRMTKRERVAGPS